MYMADGLWVDGFIRAIGSCGIIHGFFHGEWWVLLFIDVRDISVLLIGSFGTDQFFIFQFIFLWDIFTAVSGYNTP